MSERPPSSARRQILGGVLFGIGIGCIVSTILIRPAWLGGGFSAIAVFIGIFIAGVGGLVHRGFPKSSDWIDPPSTGFPLEPATLLEWRDGARLHCYRNRKGFDQ